MKIPCKQCILLCICINRTGPQIRDLHCHLIDQYRRCEISRLVENEKDDTHSDQNMNIEALLQAKGKGYVGFILDMIDNFSIQTELNKPYISSCIEEMRGEIS